MILSVDLIDEITRVLNRPQFKTGLDVSPSPLYPDSAEVVSATPMFKAVRADPDDDIVINAAYHGRADYIVSGDDHLLRMKMFLDIPIVSIAEMLDVLQDRPDPAAAGRRPPIHTWPPAPPPSTDSDWWDPP